MKIFILFFVGTVFIFNPVFSHGLSSVVNEKKNLELLVIVKGSELIIDWNESGWVPSDISMRTKNKKKCVEWVVPCPNGSPGRTKNLKRSGWKIYTELVNGKNLSLNGFSLNSRKKKKEKLRIIVEGPASSEFLSKHQNGCHSLIQVMQTQKGDPMLNRWEIQLENKENFSIWDIRILNVVPTDPDPEEGCWIKCKDVKDIKLD